MGRLALLVEVVLNNSEPKPPAVVAMGARVLEGTWWRAESGARAAVCVGPRGGCFSRDGQVTSSPRTNQSATSAIRSMHFFRLATMRRRPVHWYGRELHNTILSLVEKTGCLMMRSLESNLMRVDFRQAVPADWLGPRKVRWKIFSVSRRQSVISWESDVET